MSLNSITKKSSDLLEKITAIPLTFIGGVMVLVVLIGTFFRYVLNSPLGWTEEAARYSMIWMALIASSIALKNREHIGINMFINKVPSKIRRYIILIRDSFIAYFLYILIVEGYTMALGASNQVSPALNITMFWPLLSIPLTGLLCLLQLIMRVIIDWTE